MPATPQVSSSTPAVIDAPAHQSDRTSDLDLAALGLSAWFPHAVVRVAGMSIDRLEALSAPGTFSAAVDLASRAQRARAEAQVLSDRLHALVPAEPKKVRRKLIKLRRSLFNQRAPTAEQVAAIKDAPLRQDVEALAEDLLMIDEARAAFRGTYGRALEAIRSRLPALFSDADFGAGVRLSSRSLSDELRRLRSGDIQHLQAKAERGGLRYLTRMAAKATPFGRFCVVLPGTLAPATLPLQLAADPRNKWSRVRSNKKLMQRILDHLLADESARRQLPVTLNPTVAVDGSALRFLASSGTSEAFQAIARNEALDLVFGALQRRGAGTVRSLAASIAALDEIDAEPEEAEAYVDELLNIGLLQPDLQGLGHDPEWPTAFLSLIKGIDGSDAAAEARALLQTLVSGVERVRTEGVHRPESTSAALDELEVIAARTIDAWQPGANARRSPNPIVYEDASADGLVRIDSAHFGEALLRLRELLELLAPLAWERAQQRQMQRFCAERFEGKRIPLLEFYEIYYRDYVKPREKARKHRMQAAGRRGGSGSGETGPERDAPQKTLEGAARALAAVVRDRQDQELEATEIALSRSDIERVIGSPSPLPEEPRSASIFATWVPRPGHPLGGRIVVPSANSHLGFGKYFSRFLYLLPEDVLESLRRAAREPEDLVLAEIAGDQAFNANLRPPIQSCEIRYPTGDRIGCARSLEVGELEVGPSADGERLHLYRRNGGERIVPLDLGFLNPRMRPPLYRLLRKFSPAVYTRLDLAGATEQHRARAPETSGTSEPGADAAGDRASVIHEPRITYEDVVVLARERWTIRGDALPVPDKGESQADYFLRVQEWRVSAGIPERVYMSLKPPSAAVRDGPLPESEPEQETGEEATEPDEDERTERANEDAGAHRGTETHTQRWRDLRKPQYLDFRSPLLGRLLHRYRGIDHRFVVHMEECLPSSEHLPAGPNAERYVTESILQLELGATGDRASKRVLSGAASNA